MKQSYSLTIADMALDITTDASPEELENIVGILDRRIREILLKSRRCSKNEAALLCALGLCADKLALSEENRTLTQNAALDKAKIDALNQRISVLEASLAATNRRAGGVDSMPVQQSPADVEAAPEAPAAPSADSDPQKPKQKTKSKVGSMFDLLTFTDV